MRAAVARGLTTLNRSFPFAKGAVPYKLRRWILLNVLRVDDVWLPRPPSRLWLESAVLPVLPGLGFRKCLFVGTASYTWTYEGIVVGAGGEWHTIDILPAMRVWGGRYHVVALVQHIPRYYPAGFFDCVQINGVLGFGIKSDPDKNEAIRAAAAVLRDDGLFMIGWNRDVMEDPLRLEEVRRTFVPAGDLPFPPHMEFPGETHTYEFLVKRAGAAGSAAR